jgi:GT2 family glycosyltransferase
MRRITVIVPVRNEALAIEGTLRAILTQDYPRDAFEVIVADGASTDETVAIVRRLQGEFENLKLLFNPGRLASAARNLGVRHMTGDVAIIIDGHCHIPDRNYLRNVAQAFAESGAESLGRPQPLDLHDATPFQTAVAIARASRLGHNPSSDIYSSEPKFVEPQSTAVAYRRDVFHTIGLFDERFDACEDVEFNTRVHQAGFQCYFAPALKVVYHPRKSLRALAVQLGRYGSGRARLARKHPVSLTLPALVPPVWVVGLVVGLFITVLFPSLAPLYLGSIALYAVVILAASCWLGRGHPWPVAVRIPAVLLGIHFGYAWGFLREIHKIARYKLRHEPRHSPV